MGLGNKQPQSRENILVLDPLTTRVTIVEEAHVIDWCDKCFFPHSPCDLSKEVEEAYGDVCIMGCPKNSQQRASSTELISSRTV